MSPNHHHPEDHVLPIYGANATVIGTGTVIAAGLVVTALHVVDPEPASQIHVGNGIRVAAAASLPLRRFGPQRRLAMISYHRDRILTGDDLGTVDLALLAVPGIDQPPIGLRHSPISTGEKIIVPGYPGGHPGVATGAVTTHDDANFVVQVELSPGNSGAPAIDQAGRLAGLTVLDHDSAGAIFVGPRLLTTFIDRTVPLLVHVLAHNGTPRG
jgi:S1-C subfamily serine protease